MGVHSAFKAFLFIFLSGIGRKRNDGYAFCVFSVHRADHPCRFIAVHDRHLYIHQDEVIIPDRLPLHDFHGIASVRNGLHKKARICQDMLRQHTVDLNILH